MRTFFSLAHHHRQAGFTLIEVLCYTSLIGLVLLSAVAYFSFMIEARVRMNVMAMVENEGQFVLERITRSVRSASGVQSPSAGVVANSLTLTMPVAAENPTVFAVAGNTVTVATGAAAAVPLTSYRVIVSDVRFFNVGSLFEPSMKIEFTVSYNNPDGFSPFSYRKTFYGAATIR